MSAGRHGTKTWVNRVPLTVIERARRCDWDAMKQILCFYKAYMHQLCKLDLYEANGEAYTCFDEEMYHELESKLMMAILTKFQVE